MDGHPDPFTVLTHGEISLKGEFLWGSNYTFLVTVVYQGVSISGVYKPTKGERPLWDFPSASLAKREAAAYQVSQALGWNLVPPTVYRKDGPYGAGSVQLFIDHDPEYHYFTFDPADLDRLRPVVVFDLLTNNADRKGSHILRGPDGHLWLIDHGVCFHVEEKLRTVIWNYVGEAIPPDLCADLIRFSNLLTPSGEQASEAAQNLHRFLTWGEIRALAKRARKIVEDGVFPAPDPYRRPFPWPQI